MSQQKRGCKWPFTFIHRTLFVADAARREHILLQAQTVSTTLAERRKQMKKGPFLKRAQRKPEMRSLGIITISGAEKVVIVLQAETVGRFKRRQAVTLRPAKDHTQKKKYIKTGFQLHTLWIQTLSQAAMSATLYFD